MSIDIDYDIGDDIAYVDGKRYTREQTCQNTAPWYLDFLCSKCGFVHYHSDANDTEYGNKWHFCPNCGRRVEVGK